MAFGRVGMDDISSISGYQRRLRQCDARIFHPLAYTKSISLSGWQWLCSPPSCEHWPQTDVLRTGSWEYSSPLSINGSSVGFVGQGYASFCVHPPILMPKSWAVPIGRECTNRDEINWIERKELTERPTIQSKSRRRATRRATSQRSVTTL
jgi:hypothetical protein